MIDDLILLNFIHVFINLNIINGNKELTEHNI